MSDVEQWIDELVTRAARSINKDATDVRYDLSVPGVTYMSSTFGVNIEFKTKEGSEKHSVIVKIPPTDKLNFVLCVNEQFHNEILFYRKFAGDNPDFPRVIYINEDPPEKSAVILENMNAHGFELLPQKFNAPFDHAIAVMQGIGRFHAKAYVMKELKRKEFFDIVGDILETRYAENDDNYYVKFINAASPAVIKSLRARGYDKAFCDRMEELLGNAFHRVMVNNTRPVEPLAVLCHSDLTLNNILFGKKAGKIHPIFIDFGLFRYSTPGIDLSTFTYLCCSNEMRKEKISDLFRAYHDELWKYLVEGGVQDLKKYSYEALFEEYKRSALFGYIIAAFYLMTLMGQNKVAPEDAVNYTPEEGAELCTSWSSSEKESQIFVDMFLDIKDLGGLDHIL